jgi:hypothetical protein
MNTSFLSDLGEGVFTRLGELRAERHRRDDEQKADTIRLLAGLADKIEPESLPTLLSHMGEVMKLKGPVQKFWQAFSGMPNRGVEDQLGTKLRDITSGTVGPTTATNIRAGGDLARLFQPQTPEQVSNQTQRLQAEKDLQGKMILRDPRAERLKDLETTYGLKTAQQESLLNEREALLRKRQEENDTRDFQNALKIGQQRAELKAHGDVLKRASTIAASQGVRVPTSEHLKLAAEQIASEQGLNVDLLKARIGLAEAKIPLTQAQTKKAKLSPTAVQRVNSVKIQKAVEDFERTKQALIDATQRGDQPLMSSLRKRLQSMATNLSMKYGDKLEIGSGDWPYVKPKGQAPTTIGGDNEITLQELQEIAKRKGITLEQAKSMAQSEGLIVR